VFAGVDGHDGLAGCRSQPHQALAIGKRHLAHRIRIESDRRFQREFAGAGVGQIEGTRVCVEALGDEFDDVAQGLTEAMRSRDDLGNVGQQRDAVRNGGSPAGGCPSSDAAMLPKSEVVQEIRASSSTSRAVRSSKDDAGAI
jgi:hypothetical protein